MKPLSSEQFIKKAIGIHGDTYDYGQVSYVNNTTPIIIGCYVHGPFLQKPIYHILRKSGCPECYRDRQKYTEEYFLSQANQQFGDKFSYGVYTGFRKTIEITCQQHGLFSTTPSNHLIQDGGCKGCRSEKISKSLKEWIAQFNEFHNNKYDYSLITHINSLDKMQVLCHLHGVFYPLPSNHLRGHGCPTCACRNYVGGYSEEYFEKNPHKKTEMGILYVIRLWDDNEEFYKVGITNRSVAVRFKSVMPYEYEIIEEQRMTLYEAHKKEQQTLNERNTYTPNKRFPGWTECFYTPVTVAG